MMSGGSCDGASSAPAASTSATAGAVASTSDSKGGGRVQGTSSSAAMKKGPWTAAEDAILMEYVRKHGEGNWNAVQKNSGLSRCGKSCRLRWANHLRPNLKKGPFSPDEERLILELHAKFGNKWARMAAQLPGRTDNEIKNYWNTRIKRRQRAGLPLYPPDIQHHASALHHRPSTSGLAPSPTADLKPLYSTSIGATPLSLFDPINFPAPGPGAAAATTTTTTTASNPFLGLGQHLPFLAPSSQRAKRFREDDAGGFTLPFSPANPVAPSPLSQNPFFPFSSLGPFDLSPPPPQQQHQQLQHGFPVKTELPSSQFFHEQPSRAITTAVGLPLRRSNCELLDALLRDTHPVGGSNDGDGSEEHAHEPGDWLQPAEPTSANVKWAKGEHVGGFGELSQALILGAAGSKWDDSNHRTNADQTKKEAADGRAGSVEDDLSALLDLIPAVASAAAAPREWYNSDSGEVSNGQQSSGVTDENVGLQHLASSLSTLAAAEEDHSWSIGSGHWKDMPSAC
ncbi:hypothetical protein Taro_034935 [Colocasia esculenta]|uniref:Transcription factor GAMYB n=1 Tax=Colocasia esculenta TaxID=4460 RepID=A0A843WBM5_COLES|nr:hypothetical protein [Colocasia esculenta]